MAYVISTLVARQLVRQPLRFVTTTPPAGRTTRLSRFASKLGGSRPYLPAGTAWPRCGTCTEPMRFFVQLDLGQLPNNCEEQRRFGAQGLVQLFVCTNSESLACQSSQAFSPDHCVRLVDLPDGDADDDDDHHASPHTHDQPSDAFVERAITNFTRERNELPSMQELLSRYQDLLGPHMDDVELASALGEAKLNPLGGIKVGGWPKWAQDVEYPKCPECLAEMTNMIIQIDESEELPHMWGDSGIAHITQCPHHPRSLAFAWACY